MFRSKAEAARHTGANAGYISKVCRDEGKSSGTFAWRDAYDGEEQVWAIVALHAMLQAQLLPEPIPGDDKHSITSRVRAVLYRVSDGSVSPYSMERVSSALPTKAL